MRNGKLGATTLNHSNVEGEPTKLCNAKLSVITPTALLEMGRGFARKINFGKLFSRKLMHQSKFDLEKRSERPGDAISGATCLGAERAKRAR